MWLSSNSRVLMSLPDSTYIYVGTYVHRVPRVHHTLTYPRRRAGARDVSTDQKKYLQLFRGGRRTQWGKGAHGQLLRSALANTYNFAGVHCGLCARRALAPVIDCCFIQFPTLDSPTLDSEAFKVAITPTLDCLFQLLLPTSHLQLVLEHLLEPPPKSPPHHRHHAGSS
jgi:hypothetical protein